MARYYGEARHLEVNVGKCAKGYHWNNDVGRCVKDRSKRQQEIQDAFSNPSQGLFGGKKSKKKKKYSSSKGRGRDGFKYG